MFKSPPSAAHRLFSSLFHSRAAAAPRSRTGAAAPSRSPAPRFRTGAAAPRTRTGAAVRRPFVLCLRRLGGLPPPPYLRWWGLCLPLRRRWALYSHPLFSFLSAVRNRVFDLNLSAQTVPDYLVIWCLLTSNFVQNLLGVYVYTHVPLLSAPDLMPNNFLTFCKKILGVHPCPFTRSAPARMPSCWTGESRTSSGASATWTEG